MQDRSTYEKNTKALSRLDPETYEWLAQGSGEAATLEGENLSVTMDDGRRLLYYETPPSLRQEKENIRGMDLSSGNMTCLIGFGLGYTAKAILEDMKKGHILLILEPNPEILKWGLERFDFSDALLSGGLFILRPIQRLIKDLLVRLIEDGYAYGDLKIIPDPRSLNLFPQYETWSPAVQSAFKEGCIVVSSNIGGGKERALHELNNLIPTILSPEIQHLKPVVGGRPILLIGAGPSLEKSIEWIGKLRHKVVLMAFAASWRYLLSKGIKPHLLVTSDKNIESLGMLTGTRHAQNIPLIYSSHAHPDFIRAYSGPRFGVPYPGPFHSWLGPYYDKAVALRTGISVVSFALEVAFFLGGSPIILTGLDLAVGEYTHMPGHPMRRKINDSKGLFTIEGVMGTRVKTHEGFCSIKTDIESQVRRMKIPVLNATAFGARIHGTEEIPLEEMVDAYAPMEPIPEIFKSHVQDLDKMNIDRLTSELSGLLKETEAALKACEEGLDISRVLGRSSEERGGFMDEARDDLNRKTARVEALISRFPFLNSFLGGVLHQARTANARIASETNVRARCDLEIEKNRTALKRVQEPLDDLTSAVAPIIGHLMNMREVLTNLETGQASSLYGMALFLFRHGCSDEAREYAEKALSKNGDHRPFMSLLGKIMFQKGRYGDSRRWVEKAGDPVGEDILEKIEGRLRRLLEDRERARRDGDQISAALFAKELDMADLIKP